MLARLLIMSNMGVLKMTVDHCIAMHRCTKCQIDKPSTEFYKDKNNRSGLKSWCKKCFNTDVVRRNQTDPRYRENQKAWEIKNRDHRRRYMVDHYATHPERHREYSRKHYYKHREQERARGHNARAKRAAIKGRYRARDIRILYIRQKGKCAYCDCELNRKFHIDHIVPLSRGGSNYRSNLALACAHCNLSKHDKLVSEWIKVRGW